MGHSNARSTFLKIELMDLRGMRQKLCREVGEKKVEA